MRKQTKKFLKKLTREEKKLIKNLNKFKIKFNKKKKKVFLFIIVIEKKVITKVIKEKIV